MEFFAEIGHSSRSNEEMPPEDLIFDLLNEWPMMNAKKLSQNWNTVNIDREKLREGSFIPEKLDSEKV